MMRSLGASVAAACLMVSTAAGAARADAWVIDKAASVVRFTYDHLGVSRLGGQINGVEGKLEFSPTDPAAGQVEITLRPAMLTTGVPDIDRLLRSVDFFDAQRFPTMTFKSTAVRPTGPREGEVDGDLTMLGVTEPVTLSVTWNFTGEYPLSSINPVYQGKWVSGFSAKTVIARSRWGMKRGIPLLSDEVEVSIDAEFLKSD